MNEVLSIVRRSRDWRTELYPNEKRTLREIEKEMRKQEKRLLDAKATFGVENVRFLRERQKLDLLRAEYKRIQNKASTRSRRSETEMESRRAD